MLLADGRKKLGRSEPTIYTVVGRTGTNGPGPRALQRGFARALPGGRYQSGGFEMLDLAEKANAPTHGRRNTLTSDLDRGIRLQQPHLLFPVFQCRGKGKLQGPTVRQGWSEAGQPVARRPQN